ncbi:MFS general substrate transporter [Phlebopus sp. FC_14]|nr:MFS general substrate transporter [Phlebopus sp. FC_14]
MSVSQSFEGRLGDEKESDLGGTLDIFTADSLDPVYRAKAKILNDALQEIGMGKYQAMVPVHRRRIRLAILQVTTYGPCIITALILTPVVYEFNVEAAWLSLARSLGLLVGAAFWGTTSDVWGRRWSFNITLLITGVFGVAAGGSPNYTTLCSLAAAWSVGVGGNLPVDSAVFLEFVPASHQYLLTVLSIWWAIGQLLGSLVRALVTILYRPPEPCPTSSNRGWRYFLFTMGGLTIFLWIIRFAVFDLSESPKFLMGRGRDEEAVKVIHKVAAYNGKTSSLTVEQLKQAEKLHMGLSAEADVKIDTSIVATVMRKLSIFDANHVKPLFVTRKLAYSTSLLIILWALIGLAFPLYSSFVTYYLATRGADFGDSSVYITYRNQVILSVIGVPGALLAGYLVERPHVGRRGTLSIFTILTGIFILASTTARTSNALLGWNCAYSFTSNVMYGVLYALSPELFPTKDRGTGNALVATANRIFGVMSPIIALYANVATSVPIWVAGGIFLVAGFIALLLPFEPRGKASL